MTYLIKHEENGKVSAIFLIISMCSFYQCDYFIDSHNKINKQNGDRQRYILIEFVFS